MIVCRMAINANPYKKEKPDESSSVSTIVQYLSIFYTIVHQHRQLVCMVMFERSLLAHEGD
jgi:hypothetical protein